MLCDACQKARGGRPRPSATDAPTPENAPPRKKRPRESASDDNPYARAYAPPRGEQRGAARLAAPAPTPAPVANDGARPAVPARLGGEG